MKRLILVLFVNLGISCVINAQSSAVNSNDEATSTTTSIYIEDNGKADTYVGYTTYQCAICGKSYRVERVSSPCSSTTCDGNFICHDCLNKLRGDHGNYIMGENTTGMNECEDSQEKMHIPKTDAYTPICTTMEMKNSQPAIHTDGCINSKGGL